MPHSQPSPNSSGNVLPTNPADCASPTSYLGLTNTVSPRPTPKSVSISNQHEIISPLILGGQKNVDDLDLDCNKSYRKVPLGSKRLSGRLSRTCSPVIRPSNSIRSDEKDSLPGLTRQPSNQQLDDFLDQVAGWIRRERAKKAERKQKHRSTKKSNKFDGQTILTVDEESSVNKKRRDSDASDSSFDLDQLEDIVKLNLNADRRPSRKWSANSLRRKSSVTSLIHGRKTSVVSSDTDYFDNEAHVPSSDAVLDNSKTLSYAGGGSDDSDVSSEDELSRTVSYRDQDAWAIFKFEIVRLAHTLRLKGWRRVPMEASREISVHRLSGALTNAVYVVSPPSKLAERHNRPDGTETSHVYRKPPPKLLLRIYGPQVEHLIDREGELAILRRLAKKKIGPRLLGTFANGRFEEYFYAKPLTPDDLRHSDTSRQIAKRMRELHDGIELLDEERAGGPFVWRNWDKWVSLVEQIVTWLDEQIQKMQPGDKKPPRDQAWKRRGFICGVPWPQFRAAVDKYRLWLESQYGSNDRVREQLVFAHNDTQYGNLLRLMPTGDSPLLLPANTHKQLVVIDFEYANANTPGLEFANHFTEWCYNYHDAKKPHAFHPNRYPTREEQDRFIRAYVRHRPQYNISTPQLGPMGTPPIALPSPATEIVPSRRPTSSIGDFILDARAPAAAAAASPGLPSTDENSASTADKAAKAAEDRKVARLLHETRLWRLANTAQWVAWGLVQAKVPGMPRFELGKGSNRDDEGKDRARSELGERAEGYRELAAVQEEGRKDDEKAAEKQEEEDNVALHDDPALSSAAAASAQSGPTEMEGEQAEEEFDYLGYARHRALFFWADAVEMGVVEASSLPEELLGNLKRVSR